MSKHLLSSRAAAAPAEWSSAFISFADKALAWGLGLLCLLVSVCFYTATYDTAFIKITLFQMGGTALSFLWLALLLVQKRFPATKENLYWILPFLVYFGWNFFGYAVSPYKMEGAEEFFRYVLYFLLAFIVLDRFSKNSIRILTKCIVLAAWISCLYGVVQIADRWLPGVDIMPWRGFFGPRIFSTHANPNFFADFVVFSSFIVLAEYLRTKQKRLFPLLGLEALCLFFSESKGAWIGFSGSLVFFLMLYLHFSVSLKKQARKIYALSAVLLVGAGLLVGVYAAKRFQSVSFRAYTWSSAFAMVQDSPVLGTGVGSFKIIYPAYRKPQIFYIEKMHNNETQHAENEYLEQWATAGTIGLAVFLWFLFFILRCIWGGVPKSDKAEATSPGFPQEQWWLLGYGAALVGILIHNFFDISIRFVSTGVFFALFPAVLVRLTMPENVKKHRAAEIFQPCSRWCLRGMRILLTGAVIATAGILISQFYILASSVGGGGIGNQLLQIIALVLFGGVVIAGGWMYLRAAFLVPVARVPAVLLMGLFPIYICFGFLQADHYYGLATGFAQRGMVDGALELFQKAIEKNPFVVSYRQYRSYILRQTADMERSYAPQKGDPKPRSGENLWTDYDRIVRDLELINRRAPNNGLLHQAAGEFYYDYAVRFTKLSLNEPLAYLRSEYEAKAVQNMELAKKSFQRALLLDPVNENTYVYLANIAMMERNPVQSQFWIDAYRRGPEGITEPEFLQQHKHSERLEALERRLRQPPFNYFPAKSQSSAGEK